MNELQQKLARRRNLNGEGGAAGVPVEPDHHSSSPPGPHHLNRKSSRSNSINPPSSGTTVDELQKKLARRRSLNGESVPADGDSGTNSRQTSHEHMHDVASFAALAQEALLHSLEPTRSSDPHDLNEADLHQEKSTPSSIAHHNHIDDATSKEEHTEEVSNNIDAVPEPTSDAGMIPGESPALEYLHQDSPDDHDVNAQSTPMSTACDLVQPVDDVISSEELEIVPIEPSNPVTEAPDHSDDAPLESPQHHEDVPCADCQVAADNDPPAVEMSKVVEAVGHDHEASSDLFDSVQQPTRQLMEDDAPTHQELCCAPAIEEGALATGSEQSSEAIAAPSPAPDPVLPSSPPSSVDPVPPTSVRTPTSPQNTQPCEPTPLLGSCADEVSPPSASNPPAALSSPSTLRKVTVVNAIIHPLDPVEVGSEQEREIEEDHKEVIHPENIVKPVEAPARLSEEAPPRGSEAAAAAHSSASGANSPPPPPLSRTASSSPKVVPALNRSNSSTGTSASAPAPSSPSPSSSTAAGDRWYPGKYFYERRLPWSSKSKLHMDSDAARSHYQDFMSTSRSSSSASTSSPMMAPAAQVGHNPILQTPVPKTLREFEAENQFLRQEVERLRREVDQKQAIIDAYELSYKASVFSNTDVDIEAVRESPIVSSSPTPPAAKAVVAMEPMEDSTSNTSSGRMDPTTEGTQKVKKNRKKPTPARLLRMHSRLRTEPTDGAEDDDGEGEDDEDGGGLFGDDDEEEDGDEERKKRSGFVRGEEDFKKEGGFGGFGAGGRRIPVDLDFLNSVTSTTRLSPSTSIDNNWVDQDKALMGGDGKRRYDPRSIASEGDLVRSFAANVRGLRGEEDSITNPSLRSAINDLAQDLGTTEKSRLFQSNEGGVQSAATPSSASNSGSDSAATRSAAAANSNGPAPTQEMSYEEFMSKFSKCTELVQATRFFLLSVMGPMGDCQPPPKNKKVDYIFYGTYRLDERCRQFFDEIHSKLAQQPHFQGECEERMLCARDQLEQYVMTRLGEVAFKQTITAEEDAALLKRMHLLSFLRPEALDIRPDLLNEPLLQLAGDELRKINAFKSPGEKVACIVKCVAIIFRSLTLARQSYTYTNPTHGSDDGEGGKKHDDRHNTPAGADDFLPLFIWVVLHSFIPHLVSNCEYIHAYLNPARLMGKSGYCLINLRSAIEFVNYVESSGVNMPAEDFERELKEREELWDKRTGRGGVGGGDGKLKA